MRYSLFDTIDLTGPPGPQIFEAIKFAILRMELTPGQMLSESEFASQFGTSRTPVREALQQLRQIGLVTTQPSRGHLVTRLSKQSILEARYLREAIEIANVARICELSLSPDVDKALRENLSQQDSAMTHYDDIQFTILDDAFHNIIAKATGFPRVVEVLEREKVPLDRLRVLSLNDTNHMQRLIIEHNEIYAALKENNRDVAISATRKHLLSVLNTLMGLMDQHEDYFTNTTKALHKP